jgi:beta-galactosidase
VGTLVKEPSFYDALTTEILAKAGIAPVVQPPSGVEVSERSGEGRRLFFLINHTDEIQNISVPAGAVDLLSGETTGNSLTLDRYGIAVLKLD